MKTQDEVSAQIETLERIIATKNAELESVGIFSIIGKNIQIEIGRLENDIKTLKWVLQ